MHAYAYVHVSTSTSVCHLNPLYAKPAFRCPCICLCMHLPNYAYIYMYIYFYIYTYICAPMLPSTFALLYMYTSDPLNQLYAKPRHLEISGPPKMVNGHEREEDFGKTKFRVCIQGVYRWLRRYFS